MRLPRHAIGFDGVEERHDMRMAELADHARFLQLTCDLVGTGAGIDRFHRDLAVQMGIVGEINTALGATPEDAHDFKAADVAKGGRGGSDFTQ